MRKWADEATKTAVREAYKFIHINTAAPFETFRTKIRKWKKQHYNFRFVNLPFERGKILFSNGFFCLSGYLQAAGKSQMLFYIRESGFKRVCLPLTQSNKDATDIRRFCFFCRQTGSCKILRATKGCVTHERGRRKNTAPAETVWFTEAIFRKLLAFLLLM